MAVLPYMISENKKYEGKKKKKKVHGWALINVFSQPGK